jgi:putative ABC transport system permease protein
MIPLPESLRSTGRSLAKSPGFLAVAVATLAIGIAANAALFSVVQAVLLRPLPYPASESLITLRHTAPGLGLDRFDHSDATYLLYRAHNRTLADLGLYANGSASLVRQGAPEQVGAARLTGSAFDLLGVPAARGRSLTDADGRPGAEPVAVLSDALWRRRFDADPAVLGSTVKLDGTLRRVVGVMPPSFRFPDARAELWLPLPLDPARLDAGSFDYPAVGRLRPGVDLAAAQSDLNALIARLPEASGGELAPAMIESAKLGLLVDRLRDDVVGDVERVLWLLLGSVGVILLIACANVANLFLVRSEARTREIAVRLALGATRGDVGRLFLAEGVVLSLLGGAVGLGIAALGVRALVALRPEGLPRLDEITVDGGVLAFTLAIALLSGLAFGGFAALRSARSTTRALAPALKEGGRGGTEGRDRHRTRSVLVTAQVALALILLLGSGLLMRSFLRLRAVDPGFRPTGVLTAEISLPASRYADAAANARFVEALLARIRALPGVQSAGTVSILPLSGSQSRSGHAIEDHPVPPDTVPHLLGTRFASPGYFETLGIPLLAGRTFDRLDPARRSDGVVISRAVAEHFWPGGGDRALGKRLVQGSPDPARWFTVVGVVGDVREGGLDAPPTEAIYYPVHRLQLLSDTGDEWVPRDFALVVHGAADSAGAATALAGPVRRAVWALDAELPVARVRSMDEVLARSTASATFTLLLLGLAAAVALLLGAVGLYGVISSVVGQRTREIGVRMALGAARGDITRMVLRQGLGLTLAGIAIGLAGAFALTRLLRALLFEVSPTDPTTFVAVPLLLAGVAAVATWLPAARAAAVEPVEAIRSE